MGGNAGPGGQNLLNTGNRDLSQQKADGNVQGQPPLSQSKTAAGQTKGLPGMAPPPLQNTTSGQSGNSWANSYQAQADALKTKSDMANIPAISVPQLGAQAKAGGQYVLPERQKLEYQKVAGPLQDLPQGLDWKKLLITIADAAAGGFAGQAGKQYQSVGMQQALQRQANEQKQKEFELANEAEKQKMIDEANIRGGEADRQFEQAQILAREKSDQERNIKNAELSLQAQGLNQSNTAGLLAAIIKENPKMAIEMMPGWTRAQKDQAIKEYRSEQLARAAAGIVGGQ